MTSYLPGLCACFSLLACSPRPTVGLTIHVKPPGKVQPDASAAIDGDAMTDAGSTVVEDFSCIGFEVTITSAGNNSSGTVLNTDTGPVRSPDTCRLSRPITVEELDPEVLATITVTGFDGARRARVSGTTTVPNLRGEPADISLAAVGTPLPVLVVDRGTLLGSAMLSLADVKSMTIRLTNTLLVGVDSDNSQPYFAVDPGAYASASPALSLSGLNSGAKVSVTFTRTDGSLVTISRVNVALAWRPEGHYYDIVQQ
jgi:hypothetical protein